MLKNIVLWMIFTSTLIFCGKKIVNVPLDERFTTRVAFLNMAKITPYEIQTLLPNLLPSLKNYSKPSDIMQWALKSSDQA